MLNNIYSPNCSKLAKQQGMPISESWAKGRETPWIDGLSMAGHYSINLNNLGSTNKSKLQGKIS